MKNMANTFRDIDKEELLKLAYQYCDSCIGATKEVPTMKGAIDIKERRLPTISYFIEHYLRVNHFEFYKRSNWYDAMKNPNHPISDTIKKIDTLFEALAVDVVANEGKGIFYAKNKLGMTDKVDQKNEVTIQDYKVTLKL
jgi:hypothetical protein